MQDRQKNTRTRDSGNSPVANHNAPHLPIRVNEPADDYPSIQWRKHRRREISALFCISVQSARERTRGMRICPIARGSPEHFSSLFSIAQYLSGSNAATLAGVLRVFEVDWRCITPGFHFHDCQCRTTVVASRRRRRRRSYMKHLGSHYTAVEKKDKTNLEFKIKVSQSQVSLNGEFVLGWLILGDRISAIVSIAYDSLMCYWIVWLLDKFIRGF